MMHGGTKARESMDAWDMHQLSAVSPASLKSGCSTMGIFMPVFTNTQPQGQAYA